VSALVDIYSRFAAFGMSMCTFCSVPEEALAIPAISAICALRQGGGAPSLCRLVARIVTVRARRIA